MTPLTWLVICIAAGAVLALMFGLVWALLSDSDLTNDEPDEPAEPVL